MKTLAMRKKQLFREKNPKKMEKEKGHTDQRPVAKPRQ
jgi:hypothetical protein